mmetsp:Transcript_28383/g.69022  ORF Transcript_28383/g.69022 Transcript_28383/m.69022 type:complete len:200 (+) Transcript_28383:350-949(+)
MNGACGSPAEKRTFSERMLIFVSPSSSWRLCVLLSRMPAPSMYAFAAATGSRPTEPYVPSASVRVDGARPSCGSVDGVDARDRLTLPYSESVARALGPPFSSVERMGGAADVRRRELSASPRRRSSSATPTPAAENSRHVMPSNAASAAIANVSTGGPTLSSTLLLLLGVADRSTSPIGKLCRARAATSVHVAGAPQCV